MGLFDIFTGDPAKEAAAKNAALLQQNQTAGTNTLNQGQTGALGSLTTAGGYYQPLASKYGGATSLGLDALGVNGAAGNTRATDAFHAGPGYQYAVDQSLDAINRKGAVGGAGLGGNTLAALSDRAGNMANQEYGSWLDRLNGYVSPELQACAVLERNGTSNGLDSRANGWAALQPTISLATNYRIGVALDGANVTPYINNVAQTTTSVIANFVTAGTIVVGGRYSSGAVDPTGAPWEGPITEIVVGSGSLSTTDLNNLDAYFTAQWGT
jgi:hypothetical protein